MQLNNLQVTIAIMTIQTTQLTEFLHFEGASGAWEPVVHMAASLFPGNL